MSKGKLIPNDNEMLCSKEMLGKTILSLEEEYEILEVNTVTNYFGFFSHFQICIKKKPSNKIVGISND